MLSAEKNYDFKKRLLQVHKKDIRDFNKFANKDEFVFEDAMWVSMPQKSDDVIVTAVKDFADFLFTSMGVSVMLGYDMPDADLHIRIREQDEDLGDANGYMGYCLDIGDSIFLCAFDSRGVAQGLYYLEDVMKRRHAPYVKHGKISRKAEFSPRMIHSGYELDNFPNEHLSAIAHMGIDAILVYVCDINKTRHGHLDFSELVYRASKYGIDVYAYSCLKNEMHPDDDGAEQYYDALYGGLFRACPGLKGIVLVGESIEFPSRDDRVAQISGQTNVTIPSPKPRPGWWPCNDYPKWVNMVKTSIFKYNPNADIVFWTYNWGWAPKEERFRLIESLPRDISIMATFEMFEPYTLDKTHSIRSDYSLSFEGPGSYFAGEAQKAKECGIRLYAMANTGGLTWDLGVIPYEPMPYQWIKRYNSILEAKEQWGLCGLMESHHYGFFPSFISELTKEAYFNPKGSLEDTLGEILSGYFGSEGIEEIKKALMCWSEAITYYTPTNEDQYGAFRVGPSYPLCLDRLLKPPTPAWAPNGNGILNVNYRMNYGSMISHIDEKCSLLGVKMKEEISSLEKMRSLFADGVEILEKIPNKNNELSRLVNMGKFIFCSITTGINSKKFYMLKNRVKIEEENNKASQIIADIETLALSEIENAKSAIPLVRLDSRLGWEPSMDYITDEKAIEWKIKQVEFMINTELATYKKRLGKYTL